MLEGSLRQSVVCPVLVGRALQIMDVARLLTDVEGAQCRERALLISGEAGIGKSRLLAAVKEHAASQGWRVLQSACFEAYQALPYAPLTDLLRHLVSEDRASSDILPSFGIDPDNLLLSLSPELLSRDVQREYYLSADAAQERRRLFQVLSDLFARLTVEKPLLIVIEDIHWSDTASLSFLPVLLQQLATRPALLVVTFRDDEIPPSLPPVLAELDRQRLTTELRLEPLNRDEVQAMLHATFNQTLIGADFVEMLCDLTDGNPFFIEEVLKSLVAARGIVHNNGSWAFKPIDELQIPRSVQEAVRRRTAELSTAATEVVTLAAALGRSFDFEMLRDVTGHDEETLLLILKELVGAQLLVEESPDQFVFRHALTRAVIYNGLLARERRILHRRLAESLFESEADVRTADLAYHFFEAGVWDKALEYARRAAERARQLYAPREVITQLNRALRAAYHLPSMPLAPLYQARGQAHEILGDFTAAEADYEAALGEARDNGRRVDEWQALLDLGFLWLSRDYTRAGTYFQHALDLARTMDDPARLAPSLNRVGNWQMNRDRPFTARHSHQEALEIFKRLGDEQGIAETLDLLGISCYLCGDLAQGTEYFNRAIALFTKLDNRRGLVHSLTHLTLRTEFDIAMLDIEHLSERRVHAQRAAQLAQEMGWRAGEAFALLHQGAHMALLGEYGGSLETLEACLAAASEIEHQVWITQARAALGVLYLDLLLLPEATEQLEQALALARDSDSILMVRSAGRYLVSTYVQQGMLDQAEMVLESVLGPDMEAREPSLTVRQVQRAAVELALACGDPEHALDLVNKLIASTVNLHDNVVPNLWWLRGQALSALHRDDEARVTLEAALAIAQKQGQLPLAWRILATLGRVWLAQGRQEAAVQVLGAAHNVIDELANTLPADMRAPFRREAAARLPELPPVTNRQTVKRMFDGLTKREVEVAGLIARGYTNREIAEVLVVSERTVTTHTGNILSKLGFTSRVQVARWAIEKDIHSA